MVDYDSSARFRQNLGPRTCGVSSSVYVTAPTVAADRMQRGQIDRTRDPWRELTLD
jgi:hypothetical protein